MTEMDTIGYMDMPRTSRIGSRDVLRWDCAKSMAKAVREGKLPRIKTRKCVGCDCVANVYHHDDYSRPMWVVPLCYACHGKLNMRVLPDLW